MSGWQKAPIPEPSGLAAGRTVRAGAPEPRRPGALLQGTCRSKAAAYPDPVHIPDGFIDAPVSAAAGVIAVAGIAISLQGARRQLDERTAPLAGLVAVFVFAAQMLNFPVAAGTSGHLLGERSRRYWSAPGPARWRSPWCSWCRGWSSPTAG